MPSFTTLLRPTMFHILLNFSIWGIAALSFKLWRLYYIRPKSDLKEYVSRFDQIKLPLIPSSRRLLEAWENFYQMKEVYTRADFTLPLRCKFDSLVEDTASGGGFFSCGQEVLKKILSIAKEMPDISLNLENSCANLMSLNCHMTVKIKIIQALKQNSRSDGFYREERRQAMLVLFSLSFFLCFLTCIFFMLRPLRYVSLLEPYFLFGKGVALTQLFVAISPLLRGFYWNSATISELYVFLKIFRGFTIIIPHLMNIFGRVPKVIFWATVNQCAIPLLLQLWLLFYIFLFSKYSYQKQKLLSLCCISILFGLSLGVDYILHVLVAFGII